MKRISRKRTAGPVSADGRDIRRITLTEPDRARLVTYISLSIVTIFSAYLAVLYFGHQTVPNSDFTAFIQTGKSILSFELPSSFKRLPGLGVLQIVLSSVISGRHPGLTAGWVLNTILFIPTGVFLYLIARKVIGTAAVWYALIVLINPMILRWLCHPIAETTLIFFIVLTFYFLLRPTRWAYLPAMLTSMIRYEGAILILLCFCFDLFTAKNWKSRLAAFLRAGVAALPLALWMVGMILSREGGGGVGNLPYIRNYDVDREMVIGKFADITWSNGVGSLFVLPGEQAMQTINVISKAALAISLLLATVFCVVKKQWPVMLLLGFFAVFFALHATRTYTLPRYGVPAVWVTVLIAVYGLKSGWDFLIEKRALPPILQGILKAAVVVIALVWTGSLLQSLPKFMPLSRISVSVPYLAMAAVLVVLVVRLIIVGFSGQKLLGSVAVFTAMGLMVTSNQFQLVQKVGNGSLDREFKYMADWYYHNTEPGDILLTTLPHVVTLFLPDEMDSYIRATQSMPGQSTEEFLQNCYRQNVRYIAWDSRIGLTPDNTYYRRWKMERIAFLRVPRDYGPLKIVHQIQNEDYRYRFINIYELMPIPAAGQKAPVAAPK